MLVDGGRLVSYTYIEGDQAHTSGPNGPITRVVLHATVSPCEAGGARANARYFQQPDAGGLAHYVVDPTEVVQCCKESITAWHAPPNRGSIGVELCDPQTGDPSRWADQPHTQMLTRAAALVADICKRNNIPTVYVDHTALLQGAHGITTHFEVSQAWHQSDHTDPGSGFPIAHFLDLVRGPAAAAVRRTSAGDRWLGLTNPPMTGQDVKNVQHALNLCGNTLAENGVYDVDTATVVGVFQEHRSIGERGVGPLTWAALRKVAHS